MLHSAEQAPRGLTWQPRVLSFPFFSCLFLSFSFLSCAFSFLSFRFLSSHFLTSPSPVLFLSFSVISFPFLSLFGPFPFLSFLVLPGLTTYVFHKRDKLSFSQLGLLFWLEIYDAEVQQGRLPWVLKGERWKGHFCKLSSDTPPTQS